MYVPVGQWSCVAASLKEVPCSAAVASRGYILMSLTTGLLCFTLGLYAGVNMTKWWQRNVSSDVLTQCGIRGVFDGRVHQATFFLLAAMCTCWMNLGTTPLPDWGLWLLWRRCWLDLPAACWCQCNASIASLLPPWGAMSRIHRSILAPCVAVLNRFAASSLASVHCYPVCQV